MIYLTWVWCPSSYAAQTKRPSSLPILIICLYGPERERQGEKVKQGERDRRTKGERETEKEGVRENE